MAKHRKWNKIHALHKDEVRDILNGTCIIQEKVDGANVSIWLNDEGEITCGSRTKELGLNGGFNGFCDWVRESQAVKDFFNSFPRERLNGEWLVKHTIQYHETEYKKFFLYDITIPETQMNGKEREKRYAQSYVTELANRFGFNQPAIFATLENPKIDEVMEYVGRSAIGIKGEGIVIKNESFVNSFGDSPYAKLVSEAF